MLSESKAAGRKPPPLEAFLVLTRASHILQELTVSSYVPNNALLMGGHTVSVDTSTSSSLPAPVPSMLLLTGPNYSGKSVYMKQVRSVGKKFLNHNLTVIQVALIVYLAQIGRYVKFKFASCQRIQLTGHSFVPAESAELGITDKILTKINTQESVSKVC